MAEGQRLAPEDLELASACAQYEGKGLKEAREALEKEIIQRTLAKNKGNITQTAIELGVSRPTLHLPTDGETGNPGRLGGRWESSNYFVRKLYSFLFFGESFLTHCFFILLYTLSPYTLSSRLS